MHSPCIAPNPPKYFAPYVGRSAFVRPELASSIETSAPLTPELFIDAALTETPIQKVGHLARLLIDCGNPVRAVERHHSMQSSLPPSRIGIVVPTRDRADLLEACIKSILLRTADIDFVILIVDNDSRQKQTHVLLDQLKDADKRITVLPCPGDFNFSRLCNRGG